MLRTFLVEDEIVVRETIKKMIPWEQYGYELVGEAPDGEVALPMIKNLKPDLLITDIKMPFMDGLTLCRMVRKDFPEMKIVILSGYDDFNYAKQAIAIGVEDYLLKPITKNAFLEHINEKYGETLGEEKKDSGTIMKSSAGRFRNTKEMQAEIFLKLLSAEKWMWEKSTDRQSG